MDFKKTIEWYNQNADTYSKKARAVEFQSVVDEFMTHLPDHPMVLDAGCGDGRDSACLQASGAQVTGIDIATGLLEIARSKHPEVTFVEGNFTNSPFESDSFDGVWSHASLVHLETEAEVETVLREFSRILKASGTLYIYTKEQTGERETEVVSDTLSNHDRFFRYYTEDGLQLKLEKAGFQVVTCVHEPDQHDRPEVQWLKLFARKI